MSLGLLTSTLQTVKSLKDHEYIQQIQEFTKKLTLDTDKDYSHVTTRKTRAQLIRLSAAVCGIELCYAAETAFVSPILLKLGVPVALMTLVWCVSPLLGFFLVPVMGSLSDRCPSKLGRRRPFILLLSVGIIIGLILVPNGEALGISFGDSGPVAAKSFSLQDGNLTVLKKLNSTDSLVQFSNGSTLVVRSAFSPIWPSLKLPDNHVAGIILTIFGVAMLDFNCDACQSPCRTYLLDISVPDDHSRGLTSFTVMAGLGGSVGYLMGGIDWESTGFGSALGGHVRVVFTLVLVLYIISVVLTITSFKEIPLSELNVSCEGLQKKVKKVKKAKYRKFVNESSEEEPEHVQEDDQVDRDIKPSGSILGSAATTSYGTLHSDNRTTVYRNINESNGEEYVASPDIKITSSSVTVSDQTHRHTNDCGPFTEELYTKQYDASNDKHATKLDDRSRRYSNVLEDVSLKTYLKSIILLPRSLLILCLTNLFCWMSLVCYSLYFTDFVGQAVYGGDPRAPNGSEAHNLYNAGVRLGSIGMSLYSLSCSFYSLVVEKLVKTLGEYVYITVTNFNTIYLELVKFYTDAGGIK